jgi:hypothetical protein
MTDASEQRVTPKDIEAILEKAAKEPGINDILGLLRLSQEADQIGQISGTLETQSTIVCASGTAGWGWR